MNLLCLALTATAVSGLELHVGELSREPLVRQQATVGLVNDGPEAVAVRVRLTIKPPVQRARIGMADVTVPAGGEAEANLWYELFEPGDHAVTCVATIGDQEAARWTGSLTVAGLDDLPWLFPNYYRQNLTIVGGRKIETSYGKLAGDEARRVDANGSGAVSYDGATGRQTVQVVVPPVPTKPPLYGIDADNRLSGPDGPWFPLGIYTTPQSEPVARELVEAGFDLVRLNPFPPKVMRRYLDTMQEWGLRVWVPIGGNLAFDSGDVEDKKRRLQDMVETVGDHPALAIYESIDEPAWGGRPAWGLIEGYRYLRALDPNRPIWTNHAPRNRIQTLAWYNQATDIAGCDVYPVPMPQGQSDLPNKTYGVVADETAKSIASVHGEKPVFMVLQGFAWKVLSRRDDPTAVYPTFDESRFMAYDAIIAGANGLLYWGVAYTPKPSRFWSDLKSLASELRAIMPALEAVPTRGEGAATLIEPDPAVRLSHRVAGQRHFLLLVNSSVEAHTARIRVPAGGGWHALFGDPAPLERDGGIEVALPPWGTRVLCNDPAFEPQRKDFSAELADLKPPRPLPTEEGNSIPNPGFEADDDHDGLPDGWQVRYPFTVRVDDAVKRSGSSAARIDSEAVGFRPLAVMRNCAVEAGGRYRLSGWLRTDTPGVKARFYAEWVVDGKYHGAILPWVEPGAEWTEHEVLFSADPDPRGNLYVVVQVDGPGGAWFDDLALRPVE